MPSTRARHLLCSLAWFPAVCASVALLGCGSDDASTGVMEPPPSSHIDASTPSADGGSATRDGASPSSDSGSPPADAGPSTKDSGTPPPRDAGADAAPMVKPLGKYVMTWYSFQDNTPVNSAQSASGRALHPYVSVALPFRLLKAFGGTLDYGDKLYLAYLDGKKMPNGMLHSGWVEIDDFCGDNNDDSYCFQTVGGTKYPNVDLYIGDFTKSGMAPSAQQGCSGPAGSGQELTDVSTGDPGSRWIADYGGAALGSGKCGDYTTAEAQQGGVNGGCWDYTPPMSSVSDCASCTPISCTSW